MKRRGWERAEEQVASPPQPAGSRERERIMATRNVRLTLRLDSTSLHPDRLPSYGLMPKIPLKDGKRWERKNQEIQHL